MALTSREIVIVMIKGGVESAIAGWDA